MRARRGSARAVSLFRAPVNPPVLLGIHMGLETVAPQPDAVLFQNSVGKAVLSIVQVHARGCGGESFQMALHQKLSNLFNVVRFPVDFFLLIGALQAVMMRFPPKAVAGHVREFKARILVKPFAQQAIQFVPVLEKFRGVFREIFRVPLLHANRAPVGNHFHMVFDEFRDAVFVNRRHRTGHNPERPCFIVLFARFQHPLKFLGQRKLAFSLLDIAPFAAIVEVVAVRGSCHALQALPVQRRHLMRHAGLDLRPCVSKPHMVAINIALYAHPGVGHLAHGRVEIIQVNCAFFCRHFSPSFLCGFDFTFSIAYPRRAHPQPFLDDAPQRAARFAFRCIFRNYY